MDALERLLDLLQFLLARRVPVTFTEIRDAMPDAYGQANLQSAKRMFERDKDALREEGVPIETRPVDDLGGELGYIVDRRAYALPDVNLTPEEIGALFVAAQPTGGDDPALGAVRKLLSGSGEGVVMGAIGQVPRPVEERSPDVERAASAAADARRIRFGYVAGDGATSQRVVDAWAVVFRAGRWYLVGRDQDRGEPRAFRIGRMSGPIEDVGEGSRAPAGFDPAEQIAVARPGEGSRVARVAVAPEILATTEALVGGRVAGAHAGWPVVAIAFDDVEWFASWVLSHGERAVALEPVELRAAVVRRLEAIVGG